MRRIAARAAGLLTALLIPVVSVLPASASSGPAPALEANASAVTARVAMASYLASHWASREAPKITVSAGDSLSALAARYLGSARDWPTLWWANHAAVPDPDTITPGQSLAFPLTPAPTAALTAKAVHAVPQPEVITISAARPAAPYTSRSARPSVADASFSGSGSASGWSAYKQCVAMHESGDGRNLQNPTSTASGWFGFLSTTWTSVTGLPGPARDYSLATQSAAFDKLYAESGRSPWITDGCR
jgi:hypothetical protein